MPKKLLPILLSVCLFLSACQISSEDEISALQAQIEYLQSELDEMRNAEPTAPTEESPAPSKEPSPTPTPDPTPTPSPDDPPDREVISGVLFNDDMIMVGQNNPSEMYLYSQTPFKWNDTDTVIEMYVHAMKYPDENLLGIDDSQPWSILVRQGETVYPLISQEVVYLGELKYNIWIDSNWGNPSLQEELNILVFWMTGSGTVIYEYTYDELEQGFIKEQIYHSSGSSSIFSPGWSKGSFPYVFDLD